MNYIAFDGRLTKDPELQTSTNGVEFCKFTVAVDRKKTKKDDEKKADFIDCVVSNQPAAFLNRFFKKGDGIVVEGTLTSDKYTNKDGKSVTRWSVLVDKMGFPVGGRKSESNDANESVPVNTDDIPF